MSEFGAHLRSEWMLDPSITYLNHGTVGAPPRRVIEFQRALTDEIERQPARFLLRELTGAYPEARRSRMREAATQVASFVGADPEGLVWVDNITAGANAVLRSFPLGTDDQVFVTDLGYGGVVNAARYAARVAGAALHTITMPRPGAPAEAFVTAVADGLAAAPATGTRLLVVDHLTSTTALLLPLDEIVTVARAAGALVLVDGAHVPGQIPLDIGALHIDWYTANLHKWGWTPRSCGFLWTTPDQRTHLRPNVTSWGLDRGLADEFDLPGTRDVTAFLSAPFAISMLEDHGAAAVYAYNHDLAWWAGQFLADTWDVPFTTPESMIAAMVTVSLPARLGTTTDDARAVFAHLEAAGIEAPVYPGPECLSTRVSVQIYNDRNDIERLAEAVLACAPN